MIDIRIEGRVRVSTFSGALSTDELLRHAKTVLSSPDYDPSMDSLVDMSGITDLRVTTTDVGRVEADFARATQNHVRRIAFVATSPLTFGYARAYQTQHDEAQDEVEIFEDLAAARRWIGLEPENPAR